MSAIVLDDAAFEAVVKDGAPMAGGMPRFQELTADDRKALRHYIRAAAEGGVSAQVAPIVQ